MKKLSLLIIITMLLSLAVSCADYDDDDVEYTENTTIGDTTSETEVETEQETEPVPCETGRVVFLLYHHLVNDELSETDDPSCVTTNLKFYSDLQQLMLNGYTSLSLEDYYNGSYDESKKYYCVTFDDGYLSNYLIAYPIIRELGVHAAIFICTDNDYLENHFTWEQAAEMEESGYVKIYSHTSVHTNLTDAASVDSFVSDVLTSHIKINNRLGSRSLFFSYPNSDYSEESVKKLYKNGVSLQFVQWIHPDTESITWEDYGLVLRYNVSYDSNIMELIGEERSS